MDWIRRNWPDLLIGLALLLVIGGIIATLLNGGNILPFGRNTTNQPATVSTQTTPESTATTPVAPVEANGGSSATTDNSTTGGADAGIAAVDPNATTNDTVTMPADQGGDGTITPVSPTAVDGETVSPDAATAAVDAVAPDATDATAETATTDAATSAPTTDVLPSGSATAPYRISVGAFGSAENAERRAQAFRDAGYPVFTGSQGDLVLVLVGPYDSQAEAEGVKSQLQSSGLEANPIIYQFTPSDAAATTSTATETPATDTTQAESSSTESEATAITSAPATSSSGRYLQVGAYNSLESAAPQRTTLEGLGFTVSAVEEDSFVKLLVGPYDDSSIATAQSQLSAQGIDSFVR
jgi:cell division septation protein DedD